jgi:gluconokinase
MSADGKAPGRTVAPIVVIGPSGSGKSTLAAALARSLGRELIEGDEHHPLGNLAKMASGRPLSEVERAPFLDSVGRALAASNGAVAACSALRRAHRDRLRSHAPAAWFVWLDVEPAELERRVAHRRDHFMPPSLVASQVAAFEPPGADERALRLDGVLPVAEQVALVHRALAEGPEGLEARADSR